MDGDLEVRVAALYALAGGDVSKETIVTLIQALDADEAELRQAALDILGDLAEHRNVDVPRTVARRAIALTEDASPSVRAVASASLALIPPEDLVDVEARVKALETRLGDTHPSVRREAAAALGDLGISGANLSPDDLDQLAARLEDEDLQARFEAAYALASLGDRRALPLLEGALHQSHTRMDAMAALGRLGDPDAIPALRRVTARWLLPWADKLSGLAALVRLGDPNAVEDLIKRLDARRVEERMYACGLVGELELGEARETIRRLAQDIDEPCREAAFETLARIGQIDDVPTLKAWGEDLRLSVDIRGTAQRAKEQLEKRLKTPL